MKFNTRRLDDAKSFSPIDMIVNIAYANTTKLTFIFAHGIFT